MVYVPKRQGSGRPTIYPWGHQGTLLMAQVMRVRELKSSHHRRERMLPVVLLFQPKDRAGSPPGPLLESSRSVAPSPSPTWSPSALGLAVRRTK